MRMNVTHYDVNRVIARLIHLYSAFILPAWDGNEIEHRAENSACLEISERCNQLQCAYGAERSVDENDCVTCRCRNPCEDHSCAIPGTVCSVNQYYPPGSDEAQFRAICLPPPKPGQCPDSSVIESRICQTECHSDADCQDSAKCCYNGCRLVCVSPISEEFTTQGPPRRPEVTTSLNKVPVRANITLNQATYSVSSNISIPCQIEGNPAPQVAWYKDDAILVNSERVRLADSHTIIILRANTTDSGTYRCEASNSHGSSSSTISIMVEVPVRANITLNQTTYDVFNDIIIPCQVEGYPIPSVAWYKDDANLESNERVQMADPSTLIILRANTTDSGTYRCEASNSYGNSSSSIAITVEGVYVHPNCTDNPYFANCAIIVKAHYCWNRYYNRFCCRSCTLAGQIPSHGSHFEEQDSPFGRGQRQPNTKK